MICLFEDSRVDNFYPICELRHVSELVVGTMNLRSRIARSFPDEEIRLLGRPDVASPEAVVKSDDLTDDDVTFINGRAVCDDALVGAIPATNGTAVFQNDQVVAVRLSGEDAAKVALKSRTLELPNELIAERMDASASIRMAQYLWDLLDWNGAMIAEDCSGASTFLEGSDWRESVPSHCTCSEEGTLLLHESARLDPGVHLDSSGGPVVVDRDARIMAHSTLQGPCYVGPGSVLKFGSRVYAGTSLGPLCKVSGEISGTIIIGYSNKQHDGFVGNSYVGEWVNLGADTNTSDLKNNYGPIRVSMRGRVVDTARMFLGSLIGDHTKTAINTSLNSGTVIGPFANIFCTGFPPKEVPAFNWGGGDSDSTYRLEDALDVARTVMTRRNRNLPDWTERRIRHLHPDAHPESH